MLPRDGEIELGKLTEEVKVKPTPVFIADSKGSQPCSIGLVGVFHSNTMCYRGNGTEHSLLCLCLHFGES